MRIRTILAAAAVPAALAVTLLGATSASASAKPAAYSANAHESGVSDTTNVSGNATQDSPGGPVWALDNLERKLTATQNADGTWAVQISSQGSFSAFASPIDGNTWPPRRATPTCRRSCRTRCTPPTSRPCGSACLRPR